MEEGAGDRGCAERFGGGRFGNRRARGAETTTHWRRRKEEFSDGKPQFGDLERELARVTGRAVEEVGDVREGLTEAQAVRAELQEMLQRRYGAEGVPEGEVVAGRVR